VGTAQLVEGGSSDGVFEGAVGEGVHVRGCYLNWDLLMVVAGNETNAVFLCQFN